MNKLNKLNKLIQFTLGLLVLLPLPSMAGGASSTGGGGAGGLGKTLWQQERQQIEAPVFLGMVENIEAPVFLGMVENIDIPTAPQPVKALVWPEDVYYHAYSWMEEANRVGRVTTLSLETFRQLETFFMVNAYVKKDAQAGDLMFATPGKGAVEYHFVPPAELSDEGYQLILNSGAHQLLESYFSRFPSK